MAKSIRAYTKKNRPAQTGVMVGVRMQPDQLAALDTWRAGQPGNMSRPKAILALLAKALA
jgi:hypothetical protein